VTHTEQEMLPGTDNLPGDPDFSSCFYRGSCCPIMTVSSFPVFWYFSWFDCFV